VSSALSCREKPLSLQEAAGSKPSRLCVVACRESLVSLQRWLVLHGPPVCGTFGDSGGLPCGPEAVSLYSHPGRPMTPWQTR
jgi:hypothetical protein